MKRKRRKKIRKRWILLGSFLALLLVVGGVYAGIGSYYKNHFLPQTYVANANISNQTPAEAAAVLDKEKDKTVLLTLKNNGKTWKKITANEVGLNADYDASLKALLKEQNQWSWPLAYLEKRQAALPDASFNQTTLKNYLTGLEQEVAKLNETKETAQPSEIKFVNNSFAAEKGKAGTQIDAKKLSKAVNDSLHSTTKDSGTTLDVNKYQEKLSEEDLQKSAAKMNQLIDISANYKINGETVNIPKETLASWLKYSDGEVTVDETALTDYVTKLGEKYNTYNKPQTLASTKRGQVEVPFGTYGWSIDVDQEAAALKKAILAGKDFTRTPIVNGPGDASKPRIDGTYIEVDLTNQHMWLYKNNALVLDTDIVSGKPKSPTPTGIYYVWSKERNATLRGNNDDGSKYASPVSYWMPIDWTGVGIHDSNWQPAYGGTLYETIGSHGCINTPPSVMGTLFDDVEVGIPVLVF